MECDDGQGGDADASRPHAFLIKIEPAGAIVCEPMSEPANLQAGVQADVQVQVSEPTGTNASNKLQSSGLRYALQLIAAAASCVFYTCCCPECAPAE
jgi:hypothetical protein